MTRFVRFLVSFSWTSWGILLLVLVWVFIDSIVNPVHTPEVSPQVGPMVVGLLLLTLACLGLCLYWATRRRSTGCLITLALLLAYVVFMLVAMVSVETWNSWQAEQEVNQGCIDELAPPFESVPNPQVCRYGVTDSELRTWRPGATTQPM